MKINPLKKTEYAEFCKLWENEFGDDRLEIEDFISAFSPDIACFTLSHDGAVCSELTQFDMGELVENGVILGKALISYAICTDPAARGKGYGSAITSYAAEKAGASSCISILSPANAGLVDFYKRLGYRPYFYAQKISVYAHSNDDNTRLIITYDHSENAAKSHSKSDIQHNSSENESENGELIVSKNMVREFIAGMRKLTASEYGAARENLLADRTHIRLNKNALEYIKKNSLDGDGMISAYDGKVLCVCESSEDISALNIIELLIDPGLGISGAGGEQAGTADIQACCMAQAKAAARSCENVELRAAAGTNAGTRAGCFDGKMAAAANAEEAGAWKTIEISAEKIAAFVAADFGKSKCVFYAPCDVTANCTYSKSDNYCFYSEQICGGPCPADKDERKDAPDCCYVQAMLIPGENITFEGGAASSKKLPWFGFTFG